MPIMTSPVLAFAGATEGRDEAPQGFRDQRRGERRCDRESGTIEASQSSSGLPRATERPRRGERGRAELEDAAREVWCSHRFGRPEFCWAERQTGRARQQPHQDRSE